MHPDWQNALHQYCEEHSTPEPDLLKALSSWTWKNTPNPRMLSGHLQGRLLAFLSMVQQPKCILEIGTFTGYATLCMAEGLTDGAELHTIEADAENAFKASGFLQQYTGKGIIIQHTGAALDVVPGLNIRPDFIFVDADKANYAAYFDLCFPLLRPGGTMIFDNTLWSGRVLSEEDRKKDADTRNMDEFNKKAAATTDAVVVILPLRDGLTLVRKSGAH